MSDGRTAWQTISRGIQLSPVLRRGLPVTLLLGLVATAGRIIVPVAIQQVLDRGLTQGGVDMRFVLQMTLLALVAVAITAGCTSLMHIRLADVSETALSDLRVKAFRHIHDLSMLHQASEHRGSLVARVTSDVDQISRFMQFAGLMLMINSFQATLALLAMFVYSWQLGLVVAAVLPLILFTMRWFQTRLDAAYLIVRDKVAKLLGTLAEVVVGAPVIRAYGIEEHTRSRLDAAIEDHRSHAVKAGVLSSSFSGTGEMLSAIVLAATLVVGVLMAVAGTVSVGTVVAFLFLIQLFVQPVQMLGEAINEAQTAVAGWRRVLDVLDIPPDVADPGEGGIDLPDRSLDIDFFGVSFRYPRSGEVAADATGTAALLDVSVSIDPDTRVAVVGETGSGKTTFAKLLTRLMDPSEGKVLVGGVDLKLVRFRSLRDRVVMVPQDGMLFRGTIADNVRMGRPEATDAELTEAFRTLGLEDWLSELSQGLATPVGERGASLSVGERQLVTLVRAAIADPELLVLDEATSAVDPATEVRISRALNTLTAGRTVVTIAHRLSTAEAADRVLVFDEGHLVEDGPHSVLVDQGGVYSKLHASWQRGTSEPTPSTG
ncbi:MAG TPA: ABC transporter ATP-binding protein [Acidimicrobiia bacterium]|nr:ABC transporter ATP-binding protein [Acidimicrobiia bacterium]